MKTEHKKREIEHYKKRACEYDDLCDDASSRGFQANQKLIHDFTSRFQNTTVLDLGCGTGRYFSAIQNSKEIVGIDLSGDMLYVAKDKILGCNINLIRADVFNLPLIGKALFDIVISIGVLGVHVPLTEQLLFCIRSFLKNNGWIMFTTNTMVKHWKDVIKRMSYEFLRRRPDSQFFTSLGWRFPVQPHAEIPWLLKRKLRRSGYVIEKIEKKTFAAEGYVVTARVHLNSR